ncbi:MAG: hypothetical protein R3Y13_01980 [bacterium]
MGKFQRGFIGVENLKKDNLFKDKLLEDITSGKKNAIFPAIRSGYVSFYYKGGGLFKYDNKFRTHYKYAFVPEDTNEFYVDELTVKEMKPVSSFVDGYNQIKERCDKYVTLEAECVSVMYQNNITSKSDVILLDTEIAFSKDTLDVDDDNDKNLNRIDILLFDKESKTLVFVEAKHFSNSELWSKEYTLPPVVNQVKNYEKVIKDNYEDILTEYTKYIEVCRDLFDLDENELPIPNNIHSKVGLLIFGFDKKQQEKIKEKLKLDGSLDDIKFYEKGDFKATDMSTLYKKITK